MRRRTKAVIAASAAAVAVASLGTAVVTAAVGGDSNRPITGPALGQASAAALAATGSGRVTGTEVGDEESYYQVEVTFDDGTQVDVQLDSGFNVVAQHSDADTANDSGS